MRPRHHRRHPQDQTRDASIQLTGDPDTDAQILAMGEVGEINPRDSDGGHDGGICDINILEVGQLGNQLPLKLPPAVTPLVNNAFLWPSPPNFPTVSPGVSNTMETMILQARAKDPKNPQALLISLDPPVVLNNVADADYDVKAKLDFGIGGDRNTIIVDAYNGSQLCLAASDVTISAIYTTINVSSVPALRMGASLGYGERGSSGFGPAFTNRGIAGTPGVAGAAGLLVPPYARNFSVFAFDPATGLSVASHVNMQSLTGSVTIASIDIPANSVLNIPLPNGAQRMVVSTAVANPINLAVRFDLAL